MITRIKQSVNYNYIAKYLSVILIALLAPALSLRAQDLSTGPSLKKARTAYEALKYADAINMLSKLARRDSDKVEFQELMAGSYRNIRNYDESLKWYGKLTKQESPKPEWALYYAQALANRERYEESEQWYRRYLAMIPNDQRAQAFAKTKMNTLQKINKEWSIFYTNLNTTSSEYAPLWYRHGLIYSSNRDTKGSDNHIFQWDKTPFSDLFVIDSLENIKDSDPEAPATFSTQPDKALKIRPIQGKINTKFHEGPAVVLPDGSLIFTRNNYNDGKRGKSSEGINKLKLFIASGRNWEKIKEFPYNSNEYSVGHPTINQNADVLVFASDIPGGFGGTDLYYSVRVKNGKWGRPVNLGKRINTEGDEQFPFLDKKGNLYFASNGHPGLGGLDVFVVPFVDLRAPTKPKNLGAPVNSSGDDFSFIINEQGNEGFFSSNRKGNDDIYHFKKANYRITLQGLVVDARTKQPLPGSKVVIYHPEGIDTILTSPRGEFTKTLDRNSEYDFIASKPGYINATTGLSTQLITRDTTIKLLMSLNKPNRSQDWVQMHCDSLKRVFAVQDIYYDLDKSDIRADARPALDELARLLINHPEISVITASHCDTRASVPYNIKLSYRRGISARKYLADKGINPNRIKVEYYGKSRLVNRCADGVPCSEADQQLNRRTEFQVVINGVNLAELECN